MRLLRSTYVYCEKKEDRICVKKKSNIYILYILYVFFIIHTHTYIYKNKSIRPLIHDAGQWVRHTTDNIMETSIFYPI